MLTIWNHHKLWLRNLWALQCFHSSLSKRLLRNRKWSLSNVVNLKNSAPLLLYPYPHAIYHFLPGMSLQRIPSCRNWLSSNWEPPGPWRTIPPSTTWSLVAPPPSHIQWTVSRKFDPLVALLSSMENCWASRECPQSLAKEGDIMGPFQRGTFGYFCW